MKVNFKKVYPDAIIPKYAKAGDAGLDLTATSKSCMHLTGQVRYGLGLSVEIPEGYVGLIYPRSSIFKTTLRLSNSTGVIDSGYRGEIMAVFDDIAYDDGVWGTLYDTGDRVCQMIIMPYPKIEIVEVADLSNTERGDGGFGSSGR